MDPATIAAAAGAAIKIGSSIFGNRSNKNAAKQNYKYQLWLQQQNQGWQTEMANTAHQREVADLKAAGLNPVLSAGGNGADTGTPGGGTTQNANVNPPELNILDEMTSAKQIEIMDEQKNQIKAETGKTQAEAYKTLIDAGYSKQQIKTAEHERALIIQQIQNAKTAKELQEAEKKLKEWEARHPVASRVLSGALPAAANVAGAWVAGRALQMGQSAKAKAAKMPKVDGGKIYTSAPIYPEINPIY